MVELESKIREREIERKKRNKEIEKREIEIRKKFEEEIAKKEKELAEKKRKIEKREIEKTRVEEEKRRKKEEEELKKIEEELKKQMAEQQAQMKRLLEEEVKMPQMFDETLSKVSRFVEDCRRYTERMKGEEENKICWIVSYVQGDQTDKWKERIVDEMFEDKWKGIKVKDILKEIEREFGKGKEKKEEDIWKGLNSFGRKEDIGKEMDGFWNVVKGKEVEIVKKKPKVKAMIPRIPVVGRGSGFWKR